MGFGKKLRVNKKTMVCKQKMLGFKTK